MTLGKSTKNVRLEPKTRVLNYYLHAVTIICEPNNPYEFIA